MNQATEFVKILSQINTNISLTLFLLGLALILTINSTQSLIIWDQKIPYLDQSVKNILITTSIISLFPYPIQLLLDLVKIQYYRFRYPIKHIEKHFFVIDIKGNVFLLDNRKKEIRWIENWQTLADLHLNGYLLVLFSSDERMQHWSNYTLDEIEGKVREKLGARIVKGDYKFGGGIRTRGIPGT